MHKTADIRPVSWQQHMTSKCLGVMFVFEQLKQKIYFCEQWKCKINYCTYVK